MANVDTELFQDGTKKQGTCYLLFLLLALIVNVSLCPFLLPLPTKRPDCFDNLEVLRTSVLCKAAQRSFAGISRRRG